MLIALLADMHANRQAFSACLQHAKELGADRYVLLGDYVEPIPNGQWRRPWNLSSKGL